jgi:hypothetical protein
MTSRVRIFMWKDIRPGSRDYKIGKMQTSLYKLVIRHAQGILATWVIYVYYTSCRLNVRLWSTLRKSSQWNLPDFIAQEIAVMKRKNGEKRNDSGRAEVIVDFVFDKGLFFIAIWNIGWKPAFKVSVSFDKKLNGVEGTKEISGLPIFRNIEFLAPQKRITIFLDSSASFFARDEPTRISTKCHYLDSKGQSYKETIYHDLAIYRDIGYLIRPQQNSLNT